VGRPEIPQDFHGSRSPFPLRLKSRPVAFNALDDHYTMISAA
jgi:hypothetical protein